MGLPDDYAGIARLYDPFTAPFLLSIRKRMVSRAISLTPRRTLDLCCGTGVLQAMLGEKGLWCAGLDLSPAMLARAAGRIGPAPPPLALGDAARTPFQSEVFDLVTAAFCLHEIGEENRLAALAETRRMLSPQGLLLTADYGNPRRSLPGRAASAGVDMVERMAGREHHAGYADFLARGALPGLLNRGGFATKGRETFFFGACLVILAGPV